MHKRLVSLLLILCAVSIGGCGGVAAILDVQSSFSTSSGDATLDQVSRQIITASSVKGWKPEYLSAGHINAVRRRSGHVANVDIFYTTDSFQIKYKDSDNMDYDGTSISSTYSTWVEELRDEIKRRLSEL